jgi:hypothetical protein
MSKQIEKGEGRRKKRGREGGIRPDSRALLRTGLLGDIGVANDKIN